MPLLGGGPRRGKVSEWGQNGVGMGCVGGRETEGGKESQGIKRDRDRGTEGKRETGRTQVRILA